MVGFDGIMMFIVGVFEILDMIWMIEVFVFGYN